MGIFKFLNYIFKMAPPVPGYRIIPIMDVDELIAAGILYKTEPLATYLADGWHVVFLGKATVGISKDASLAEKLMGNNK